ncbi:MAG: DUF167 domain-containing protein [Rhodospirillaceae bacterium]|jgi:uncharacterized protein|nr:DUF167 domain-containing protein [Rhodospirillaceae bacterium]MBT4489802.1 DUF167 domain-containing protein [Rhodospirillaceae bacterium]MBT5192984.1 DUF167 domain-containing protein [Rhodospirillaceae bacterium]MBT5896946.1 DUF167 domain-containing protein [Rhodospirillaceae bacterium]MBT6427248.1 DUF167 domain-containing protein [Rhodospirillaceae bacterium]
MPFIGNDDGVLISVRLRPGASANRIDGIQAMADGGRRLCLRVTAVPEKGKANQAMIKLLAKAWRIAAGRLSVVSGAKDRNKKLLLQGDGGADLVRLRQWQQDQISD